MGGKDNNEGLNPLEKQLQGIEELQKKFIQPGIFCRVWESSGTTEKYIKITFDNADYRYHT